MEYKLTLAVMVLLALPSSAESGACDLHKIWGGYFIGQGRVHNGFMPEVKRMSTYAFLCKVLIHLAHTFIKDKGGSFSGGPVKPSKYSNHFVGHAIDMSLTDVASGMLCHSECLADATKQPAGVKCFISKIRQDSVLRWGGDFNVVQDYVQIDDGINVRDFPYYQELYALLQTNC